MVQIKTHFGGVGVIKAQGKKKKAVQYQVTSIKDLINVIIPHFEKFPLITQKRADFNLFKKVIQLMGVKKHLTIKGLHLIVAIKATINRGLSDDLKKAFPNTSS